ncbi:hypothetical protein C8F01DRAFT_1268131 [Mycena amicta]|nr:hypothetical protein C8F01DRAFT_1268131 [Mycena amicta]
MARARKQRPRIARPDRRSLRGWAEGGRQRLLERYLAEFTAAMDRGRVAEARVLKRVIREYLAVFPWDAPDTEDLPYHELPPDAIILPPQLLPDMQAVYDARVKVLLARIRRWFRYRATRTLTYRRTFGTDPTKDPYACTVIRLSGWEYPKKALQGYQQFMRERYFQDIEPLIKVRWAEKLLASPHLIGTQPKIGFRGKIARFLFGRLPQTMQNSYQKRAVSEALQRKTDYKNATLAKPSSRPESRSAAIDRLPDFMAPILQEISNVTGLHATLLVGGPDPKCGGDITPMHITYGRSLTTSGLHWPDWKPKRFETEVLEFYVEFLKTCFTPEDCARAALPKTQSGAGPSNVPRAVGTAVADPDDVEEPHSPGLDSGSEDGDLPIIDGYESDNDRPSYRPAPSASDAINFPHPPNHTLRDGLPPAPLSGSLFASGRMLQLPSDDPYSMPSFLPTRPPPARAQEWAPTFVAVIDSLAFVRSDSVDPPYLEL